MNVVLTPPGPNKSDVCVVLVVYGIPLLNPIGPVISTSYFTAPVTGFHCRPSDWSLERSTLEPFGGLTSSGIREVSCAPTATANTKITALETAGFRKCMILPIEPFHSH